jgi:hypothetical protein
VAFGAVALEADEHDLQNNQVSNLLTEKGYIRMQAQQA